MIGAPFSHPLVAVALTACLLPLVSFVSIVIGLHRWHLLSARVALSAVAGSWLCSLYLLIRMALAPAAIDVSRSWMMSSGIHIPVGLLIDPLSVLMLCIVSTISWLVQIYSLGYMAGDPRFSRYYAYMSLFAWAMMSLTVSSSLFQLYMFWELVGLSSYLLIGFWFERFSASQAGKKAFVMTRLGDVAFLLGLFVIFMHTGHLDIAILNGSLPAALPSGSWITIAALLVFGGIVGKSAQFPLLTWLPDAMEGPTPVSALLHSATMVAAGVYLMARMFGFFSLSPAAMGVFLAIGTISMLMASTMAMVSRDIKQVWAYSTISQLGFMIMGLAAGGYSAGVFHLTTHAGFKALLFLCSGVFIHAIGTNDMVAIGRAGGGRMKIPMICMAIAAASLSGIPPFSGFFSKELILGVLARQANPVWITAGLLGAFLTAYYTFRLIFTILVPDPAQPRQEGHTHAGESGADDHWMMPPLIILAGLALILGWIEPAFVSFLNPEHSAQSHSAGFSWIAYAGMGACFAGVLLAWIEFGRKRAPRIGFVERLPGLAAFFSNRWYLDRLYQSLLAKLVDNGIARLFAFNDTRIIDGALDGLGAGADRGSERLGFLQTLSAQTRLAVVYSVLVLLALASLV